MYIISKFKDYYDSALGVTGIDKSIVYDRKIIELENKEIPLDAYKPLLSNINMKGGFERQHIFYLNKSETKYKDVEYFLIGFCGKYYLGFKFYYLVENDLLQHYNVDFKYDLNEIKKHLDLNNHKKYSWKRRGDQFESLVKAVNEYDSDVIFRKYNTPCFVYHYATKISKSNRVGRKLLTINPNLKDFEFAKVVDPFSAFQEIQMYISGVLGVNEKPVITVSDKDRIAAHGFDKWSFRKPPKNG